MSWMLRLITFISTVLSSREISHVNVSGSLIMERQLVSETLVFNSALTQLIARDDFITNHLHYKDQFVKSVWGSNRIFRESHETQKCTWRADLELLVVTVGGT
jgi:hypothetical protein